MSAEPEETLIVYQGCIICGQSSVPDGHIRDCIANLKLRCRGFQVMAREMFHAIEQAWWMALIQEGKYERAGGDVECKACRMPFVEHPELPKWPTFHMLCSGAIVKT